MKSVSAKTIVISEKKTTPNLPNITSECSCDNCDSYRCFDLRNRTDCSCEKYSAFSNEKVNPIRIKTSSKTFNMGGQETIKNEISYENSKEHLTKSELSGAIKQSRKGLNPDTAKLSAQIMNLPFNDFKQSVSYNTGISRGNPKLNKLDIFRKIKEAYEACSCKICECLSGKPNYCKEVCKCKPCQCADCTAIVNNLKFNSKYQQPSKAHAVARCDEKDCKGFVKKSLSDSQYCDCAPCECLKCYNTYNEPCNCKPCECIECRAFSLPKSKQKPLVVGRVREDVPRGRCSCSPCDCSECIQNLRIASNLQREISTGVSRPPNCNCETCASLLCETSDSERCSCDIQKQIMQKPFEKDTENYYDIHFAAIDKFKLKDKPNSNPVTMFAAVKTASPKSDLFSKECDCGDFECLVCNQKNKVVKENIICNENSCTCSPCECEVCKKCNIRSTVRIPKPCTCDICSCLDCEGYINMTQYKNKGSKKITKTVTTNHCKCTRCECVNCNPLMCNTSENNYCQSQSTVSCDRNNQEGKFVKSNDIISKRNTIKLYSEDLYTDSKDTEMLNKARPKSTKYDGNEGAVSLENNITNSDIRIKKEKSDIQENHEIENKKNILEPISKHFEVKTIKYKLNNELVNSHKHIHSVKRMSQDLLDSIKEANQKFSKVQYRKQEESNINEHLVPTKCDHDKIEDKTSKNEVDFEKIKHSLKEAKAFSMELIKLLQQYQKANNAFKKISYLEFIKRRKEDSAKNGKYEKEKYDMATKSPLHTNKDHAGQEEKDKTKRESKMYSGSNNLSTSPTTSYRSELINYLLSVHETDDFWFPSNHSEANQNNNSNKTFNDDHNSKESLKTRKEYNKTNSNFNVDSHNSTIKKSNIHTELAQSNSKLCDTKQILATSTSTFTLDETVNKYSQLNLLVELVV